MLNGNDNPMAILGAPNGNSELGTRIRQILPNLGDNILNQVLESLRFLGVTNTTTEEWEDVRVEDIAPPLTIIQARRLIARLSAGKKPQATTGSAALFGNMTREEYDKKRIDLYLRVKELQQNIHAYNVFSRYQEQLAHRFDLVWSNLKSIVPIGIASSVTLLQGNEARNRRYLAAILIVTAVAALQWREGSGVDSEAKEMGGGSLIETDHPASNNDSSCRNDRSECCDIYSGNTNNTFGTSV